MEVHVFIITTGDIIYGRIDTGTTQLYEDVYRMHIERVLLCAGKAGYIPLYDPDQGEFGCRSGPEKLDTVLNVLVSLFIRIT